MKKNLLLIIAIILTIPVYSQEEKVKTGWKFGGALPAVSYDSNLGFQYGALVEFFNYGDGSNYPAYLDHLYVEGSRFTGGSGIYRVMFESNHIIPGVEWSSDLSYLPDKLSHFYGFNGYESAYYKEFTDTEASQYYTNIFYRFQKDQFRFKNDFQGKLSGDNLKWNAGFAMQNFNVSSADIDKINKRKDEGEKLPSLDSRPSLFDIYKGTGIIPQNEFNGGWINTVKVGVSWDSRDNKPNPMKGIWTEAGIEIAPKFLGNNSGFSKFYFTHRQYFTLVENDLSLVYRVGYQTTLAGHTPFYYQSQVITSRLTGATSEGLGGSSSMRGILRNRIIGDGFAYANIELRWKPIYFDLFNQSFYIGLNGFYDIGVITKPIKLPENMSTQYELYCESLTNSSFQPLAFNDIFKQGEDTFHHNVGISLMIAMNQNFVIAVDMGKALNPQDGNIGFSIGLNYLF